MLAYTPYCSSKRTFGFPNNTSVALEGSCFPHNFGSMCMHLRRNKSTYDFVCEYHDMITWICIHFINGHTDHGYRGDTPPSRARLFSPWFWIVMVQLHPSGEYIGDLLVASLSVDCTKLWRVKPFFGTTIFTKSSVKSHT